MVFRRVAAASRRFGIWLDRRCPVKPTLFCAALSDWLRRPDAPLPSAAGHKGQPLK